MLIKFPEENPKNLQIRTCLLDNIDIIHHMIDSLIVHDKYWIGQRFLQHSQYILC